MKKTVPFELFGANQYLMFDISRLDELEKKTGISIPAMTAKDDYGFSFAIDALPVAMKQHFFNLSRQDWVVKITQYIENGGDIADITRPIVMAIWLSGALGKQFQKIADTIVNKKPFITDDEVSANSKNDQMTESPSIVLPNG